MIKVVLGHSFDIYGCYGCSKCGMTYEDLMFLYKSECGCIPKTNKDKLRLRKMRSLYRKDRKLALEQVKINYGLLNPRF